MRELALTRSDDHRHRFVLDGVGALTRHGLFKTSATVTADDGREWTAARRGLTRRVEITDASGTEVGRFTPAGTFRRGGRLDVNGRHFTLRPSSMWKERYALAGEVDQELATIQAGGWSGTKITVETAETRADDVDPLVLLTACWLVRQFADDSAGASTATAGAST